MKRPLLTIALFLLLGAVVNAGVACSRTTKYGDALLKHWPPSLMVPGGASRLELRAIPVGAPATLTYEVTNLPHAIYPRIFKFPVSESEVLAPPERLSWGGCVVTYRLLYPDGTVFHEDTQRLGDITNATDFTNPWQTWRGGALIRNRGRRLPPLTTYVLEIVVEIPSSEEDFMTLEGSR